MFCIHCGKSIMDESVYCSNCGKKQSNEKLPLQNNKIEITTDNKFRKFIKDNKGFVVFILVWTFIHILLLLNGDNENGFFPFNENVEIDDYGFVEFFVYETLPILIFIINKLVGKEIKKVIDQNN